MSVYYSVPGWDDAAVDVPNPGCGQLEVFVASTRGPELVRHHVTTSGRQVLFQGGQVGRLLSQLTVLAFAREPDRIEQLGVLTVEQARCLLPVVVRASLYAAGGTDAGEVMNGDEETGPWCVICGYGSVYSTRSCRGWRGAAAGDCERTRWCDLHGHTGFAGQTVDEHAELPS
jgi:hypothetical protein